MLKKLYLPILFAVASAMPAPAQQTAEKLNRAPVAVKTSEGILVTWRSLTSDDNVSFNIYRNGIRIAENMATRTNLLDREGKVGDIYKVESSIGETAEVVAWNNMFKSISVARPEAIKSGNTTGRYRPDDISVGDLDGDGDYEIVLKWMPDNARDNGSSGYSSPCILSAFKLDGTPLWNEYINLGRNIRSGNHYTQFLVYDFDGDGKAEIICQTAPGSKDGNGNYVTETGNDAIKAIDNTRNYVNSNGHVTGGEELLTVFNGETGAAMNTIWYSPSRSATDFPTKATAYSTSAWGDSNYNRGNRFNAAVAYVNGIDKLPCAIMQRGYYTQCYLWAVQWDGKALSTVWLHKGLNGKWSSVDANGNEIASGTGKSSYGQGVHGISVADVNNDGCDDIIIGSAAIDHRGTLLYSTGKGHGDAIHVADLCPDRDGLEVMMPHEESPYGYDIHDAQTGKLIVQATSTADNGRGLAADLIPANRGYEFWSSASNSTYDCTTGKEVLDKKSDTNFRIYWNGDPYDQTFDGRYDKNSTQCSPRIRVYNTSSRNIADFQLFADYGNPSTCNTTKATPCLQADILGDWREEIIMYEYESDYSAAECKLLIYSTPESTVYKVPCLMQDHVYRMGVAWQNSSYNQPPHLGYYLPDYLGINGETYATHTTSHAPEAAPAEEKVFGEEIVKAASEDQGPVFGTCYTAGSNSEFAASATGAYVKMRTGNNDEIVINVNDGYVITGIKVEAYSNNKSTTGDRSIDLTGIYVDDNVTESVLDGIVTFPGGTAGQTPKTIQASGFEAEKYLTLTFDNSRIVTSTEDANGKNKQILAIITLTWKKVSATGIEVATSTFQMSPDGQMYNLRGQRILAPQSGEIYIMNGKKYIGK